MKTVLAFSGGKDSWACLWLFKDRLDEIEVVWVNTGKNFPEILASIALAKALCPKFTELTTSQAYQTATFGLPADVVPVNWTVLGQSVTGVKPTTVQPYTNCCTENKGRPLHEYCKASKVTHLIRGQRNSEGHKAASRNDDVIDGVTYVHPIEDWSAEEVLAFNAQHMDLPDHFKFKHSSMDCYDCTAFIADTKDIKAYAEATHPELYAAYKLRKDALDAALIESIKEIM